MLLRNLREGAFRFSIDTQLPHSVIQLGGPNLNENQLYCLQIAKQALHFYDLGTVHIGEHKLVGHFGSFAYTIVKFRVSGASSDFLVNVHDAHQGRGPNGRDLGSFRQNTNSLIHFP